LIAYTSPLSDVVGSDAGTSVRLPQLTAQAITAAPTSAAIRGDRLNIRRIM
jgi:hypothetical protein